MIWMIWMIDSILLLVLDVIGGKLPIDPINEMTKVSYTLYNRRAGK